MGREPTQKEIDVARALFVLDYAHIMDAAEIAADLTADAPDMERIYLPQARAAIRAMREPTKEMWRLLREYNGDDPTGEGDWPYAWAFMIDAASPPIEEK